jgi:hypothetical protein
MSTGSTPYKKEKYGRKRRSFSVFYPIIYEKAVYLPFRLPFDIEFLPSTPVILQP